MVEMMYCFYRLTFREKFLCILSFVAILSAIWLYLVDSFTREKQWYLAQINTYSTSVAKANQREYENKKVDAEMYNKSQYLGDIINIIQQSVIDIPELTFLSIDIAKGNSTTVKLKGDLVNSASYLSRFNQKNPDFYWDYISYNQSDFEGVLEIRSKIYVSKGGR